MTEARGNTFADVEISKEPAGLGLGANAISVSKRSMREALDGTLDGLRRFLARPQRRPIQSSK